MFLLDTNVIFEMMKTEPSLNVMTWVDRQESNALYISTITIAEIAYGIGSLPEGSRRIALDKAFNKTIIEAFESRILLFDEHAAQLYGKIMSSRKQMGKPMSIIDGQIAAIACVNDLNIVTRNKKDFLECGMDIIDPF
jgi:predicted nucleic acid-binding protein